MVTAAFAWPGGRPAFDTKPYAFLHKDVAPATVNPSLWRQAQLNAVNGLFNLSPDKLAVMREIRRVLRPTGRLVVCEVALTTPLAPGEADSLDDWFR